MSLNAVEQDNGVLGKLGASLGRRRFLKGAGAAAGVAGVVGVTAGCGSVFGVDPSNGPAPSVADVLNFALNLEYLEANFYSWVVSGGPIPAGDQGSNPGTITNGVKFTFQDPNVAALAAQLAADELSHVVLLRAAISQAGFTPVDQPALNLSPLGALPPSYAVDAVFLSAARSIETVGTSAYEGGIQYLVSNPAIVTAAAIIHDTEARCGSSASPRTCPRSRWTATIAHRVCLPPGSSTPARTRALTPRETPLRCCRSCTQLRGRSASPRAASSPTG